MRTTRNILVALCLVFFVGRCDAQSAYLDADGNLVVDTDGGAVAIWVNGEDITAHCVSPYCNGEFNLGTDGLEYFTLLGYGTSVNLWTFFNLEGQEGVYLDHEIIAEGVGDAEFYCSPGGTWVDIFYGPGTGIPDFGAPCVPEPTRFPVCLLVGVAYGCRWSGLTTSLAVGA